ncbi:hypothetical protein [Methylovirgula sp. 4M-Z18]|uniref:hypothetical protein n=1 Tax=Methylovirgula sp. 4M-Z18 TaxID=2293567 RepID=UPI001FE1F87C|nr:hypothetical protein [Methylovirgula sp. 4M-Z18]
MVQIHVILSLIGLVSGFVVLYGWLSDGRSSGWTGLFLVTTILTSVTGFFIPPFDFDPPRVVGLLSLVLLAFACVALYVLGLAGVWRRIYVCTALAALYLNAFVAVVQSFQKIGFLHDLAPTQTEPSFIVAQVALLVAAIVAGVLCFKRFGSRMA